jgi:hypothetical protein
LHQRWSQLQGRANCSLTDGQDVAAISKTVTTQGVCPRLAKLAPRPQRRRVLDVASRYRGLNLSFFHGVFPERRFLACREIPPSPKSSTHAPPSHPNHEDTRTFPLLRCLERPLPESMRRAGGAENCHVENAFGLLLRRTEPCQGWGRGFESLRPVQISLRKSATWTSPSGPFFASPPWPAVQGKLREAGCRGCTAAFGMGKAPNLRLRLLRANTRASYLTRPTFR